MPKALQRVSQRTKIQTLVSLPLISGGLGAGRRGEGIRGSTGLDPRVGIRSDRHKKGLFT